MFCILYYFVVVVVFFLVPRCCVARFILISFAHLGHTLVDLFFVVVAVAVAI